MASGTIPSLSHSLRMVTAISLPPWYTSATTPVARSSSCISCGVVAGFTGTHVCLSMTERSTDMSSGSVGHGDAHAGSRLGHSPRLELIVHLVDEVLQLRVRQRRAVVHRRDGRFGRVRDEVADGPVPRQALGEPIAGEEALLDAKVGSLDEEVREGARRARR